MHGTEQAKSVCVCVCAYVYVCVAQSYIFHDWEAVYDGDMWQRVGLCARKYIAQMADVPTLIICSWYVRV